METFPKNISRTDVSGLSEFQGRGGHFEKLAASSNSGQRIHVYRRTYNSGGVLISCIEVVKLKQGKYYPGNEDFGPYGRCLSYPGYNADKRIVELLFKGW